MNEDKRMKEKIKECKVHMSKDAYLLINTKYKGRTNNDRSVILIHCMDDKHLSA